MKKILVLGECGPACLYYAETMTDDYCRKTGKDIPKDVLSDKLKFPKDCPLPDAKERT